MYEMNVQYIRTRYLNVRVKMGNVHPRLASPKLPTLQRVF